MFLRSYWHHRHGVKVLDSVSYIHSLSRGSSCFNFGNLDRKRGSLKKKKVNAATLTLNNVFFEYLLELRPSDYICK